MFIKFDLYTYSFNTIIIVIEIQSSTLIRHSKTHYAINKRINTTRF